MKTKIIAVFAFVCVFATAAAYCQTQQSSTDKAIINVKGAVKSVTEKEDFFELVYAFDANGKMTKYQSTTLTAANTKRDSQGRLESITLKEEDEFGEVHDAVTRFTYDAQGRLSKKRIENVYGSWAEIYTYNAQGQLVGMETAESVEKIKFKYQYIAFDANGNWTKMIKSDAINGKVTITRKIVYY